MADGTTIFANVKKGAVLTEKDKQVLAEWVQFVRDRRAKAETAGTRRLKIELGRSTSGERPEQPDGHSSGVVAKQKGVA
jgi:hypothetical protein